MITLLRKTRSVCPVCLKQVNAVIVRRADGVYMEKTCPAHGDFSVPVWRDNIDLESWRGDPPEVGDAENLACPQGCAGCTEHRQGTCCVLLEVTQACNLHCSFCFAHGGEGGTVVSGAVSAAPAEAAATAGPADTAYATVADGANTSGTTGADGAARTAAQPDIATLKRAIDVIMDTDDKPLLQFSGGEPTLRDDLPALIAYARARGCRYTQLNTNGVRLAEDEAYVQALAEAGLSFVFLQFDGIGDEVNIALRGQALYETKLRAIRMCDRYHIGVTLVPTVVRGVNDTQIGEIIRLGASLSPAVRGVHFQPVSYFGRYPVQPDDAARITLDELLDMIHLQAGVALSALLPSRCDHPLCGFHGSFLINGEKLIPLSNADSIEETETVTAKQNREYVGRHWERPAEGDTDGAHEPMEQSGDCCCDGDEEDAQDGGCCGGDGATDTSGEGCCCDDDQDEDCCCTDDYATFDGFLEGVRKHGFTLSAMAFQDAMNLDIERLRQCSLHVYRDGAMMPFCARYLTPLAQTRPR